MSRKIIAGLSPALDKLASLGDPHHGGRCSGKTGDHFSGADKKVLISLLLWWRRGSQQPDTNRIWRWGSPSD
jgi:hypothetical protein